MAQSRKRGWLQIAVSVAVVLSFLIATAVAWLRSASIDADVDDIVGNAMPSVQLLASARTDVHLLAKSVDEYADGAPEESTRIAVRSARSNLDAALLGYVALPFFPGEHALYDEVRDALAALDAETQRTLDRIGRGDSAVHQAVTEFHRRIDIVDRDLSRVIAFDATQGQRLGLSVANARRSAGYTLLLLDVLAIGLAAFATALAVRAMRQDVGALEAARDLATKRASISEERNAELDQFAGRVAHDVLSPLMAVGIALELAKARTAQDAKGEQSLDRGLRALLRVRRIVEGLLEFARAGAKPAADAAADVREVIADVVEGTRADAEAANIELAAATFEACTVACSPGALTSISSNLVRNAIKHMGDARVRCVTLRVTSTAETVRVEVEDSGPGIPPEAEPKIFEPFTRGATSAPGIGLGLATVKRLAVAHGGRVGCRTRVGVGSTFWFELPRREAVGEALSA